MTFDFRASQLRTSKIIVSGSTGTNAKLLLYPISVDGSPLNQGNIDPTLFGTGSIGQDVFLFVSGTIAGTDGTSNGITLLGGDLGVSGSVRSQRNIQAYGNISFKDSSSFSGSLSSSLTGHRVWQLPDADGDIALTNRILAGTGISVNSYANGYVGISSSVTPSIFEVSGGEAKTTYRVSVDSGDNRYPSAIGSDVWWFVSGSTTKRAVFGGDLVVSGTLYNSDLLTLGSGLPLSLAIASIAGTSSLASREDHQHVFPSANDVGAIPMVLVSEGDVAFLSGAATTALTTTATGRQFMQINTGSSGSVVRYIGGAPIWSDPDGLFSFQAGPFITISTASAGVVRISSSLSFSAGPYTTINTSSNGNIQISSSLSFLAGPGVTVNTNSNGTIAISGSSYALYQPVAGYNFTSLTSSTTCGQVAFTSAEVPTNSLVLRVVLSTITASNQVYVKLYNHTSGAYVCIGGGSTTILSSSATTPTKVDSVNLFSATNWSPSDAIYELELYTSNSLYLSMLGNAVFVYS